MTFNVFVCVFYMYVHVNFMWIAFFFQSVSVFTAQELKMLFRHENLGSVFFVKITKHSLHEKNHDLIHLHCKVKQLFFDS